MWKWLHLQRLTKWFGKAELDGNNTMLAAGQSISKLEERDSYRVTTMLHGTGLSECGQQMVISLMEPKVYCHIRAQVESSMTYTTLTCATVLRTHTCHWAGMPHIINRIQYHCPLTVLSPRRYTDIMQMQILSLKGKCSYPFRVNGI